MLSTTSAGDGEGEKPSTASSSSTDGAEQVENEKKKERRQFGKKDAADDEGGEDGNAGGKKKKKRVFKMKRTSSSPIGKIIRYSIFLGVAGGLGYCIYKIRQPEFTMPLLLENLDQNGVCYIANAFYYYLQFTGAALEWREAMANSNGVAHLINYINGNNTPEAQRVGMSLLSLLAEYEKTRPYLRNTTVFKTAAHYLNSDDVEVKGASLNVLIYMFQDKPSATLVVDSGVLKLMCNIAAKAFKEGPERFAGELALQAISKIPNNYPGGARALMKKGLDEQQLNCIFAAMHSDLIQLERQGDFDKALKVASECIAMNPQAPEFYQISARIQSSQGNLEGAIWNMKKAVKFGHKEPQHKTFLVQLLLESGRPKYLQDARDLLNKLVNDQTALGKLSSGQQMMDDDAAVGGIAVHRDEKMENLSKEIRVSQMYMQMVKADLMLRDYRSASGHVHEWLKRSPNSAPALYSKAKVLSHRQRYPEALTAVNESLGINPQRPESLYLRAFLLYKLGKADESLDVCHKVVRLLRRDVTRGERVPNLHLLMGKIYEGKEQFSKAEHSYEMLVKADPSRPMPHFRRGRALLKAGQEGKANSEFGEVLRLWSDVCIERKSCKNYFYRNQAAANAMKFIGQRCNGVECRIPQKAVVVETKTEGGTAGSQQPPSPPRQMISGELDIKDMCGMYARLKSAD
mmetsp:Transcript_9371/g.15013  ORF Transcript_9371/g.15013 Transcript_9371/m.15013 type:complete len:688 (+) Transcript_9371:3-2066(+)